jgi:putative aldouronate transport system permease protein
LKQRFWQQEKYRNFLILLPFIVFVVIFSYMPLRGWILAFFNYRPGVPLSRDNFVGFENFRYLFGDKYARLDLLRVLRNDLGMDMISFIFSPIGMVFAILLNEIKILPYRKGVQILTTIPNFISWVLVYAIAYALFSVDDGLVNKILMSLGLIDNGINWLYNSDHTWLKMWAWGIWKGLGYGSIVYIAAITGIDQELYEAAVVDGAGRFRSMWHVTLPGVLPTYFVLLIMQIASLMGSNVEQLLLFTNALNKEYIESIGLYVYNQGIAGVRYSFSICINIITSIVSILLLFLANNLSKLIREEKLF